MGFVLVVSAVKVALEDYKRHIEDDVTNNSISTKVDIMTGEEREIKWKHIKVGDVLKVKDDELFPADLLCLRTGLEDKICFIKTTNLDGETNLKIRKPIDMNALLGKVTSTDSNSFEISEESLIVKIK